MGKMFSRETAEKAANLLKHCYVEAIGRTYSIKPRTLVAFDNFGAVLSTLKECGYNVLHSQINPGSPKEIVVMHSEEFAFKEELPGENILRLLSSFKMVQGAEDDAWNWKIVLTSVQSSKDLERFESLKRELDTFGYYKVEKRDNYLLLTSTEIGMQFDEATYYQVLQRIA